MLLPRDAGKTRRAVFAEVKIRGGDYSFFCGGEKDGWYTGRRSGLHQLSSLLFSCGYISCDLTPPPPPPPQEEPRRSDASLVTFKDNQNRIQRNAGRTRVLAEPQVADERR